MTCVSPGCASKLSSRHYRATCDTGGPSPHVPLLQRHEDRLPHEEHLQHEALRPAQHTPLRPIPLVMQRSPAVDSPMAAGKRSPLALELRTPSKFVPYTGDLYLLEGVLGKGAFGLVSLMRSVLTGELVAMKTIEKARLQSDYLRRSVSREIKILKALRHRGVVELYEVVETPESIHLVLEYAAGGSVQQLVAARGVLPEEEAARLLWLLLDAVEHCHARQVSHRDLLLRMHGPSLTPARPPARTRCATVTSSWRTACSMPTAQSSSSTSG